MLFSFFRDLEEFHTKIMQFLEAALQVAASKYLEVVVDLAPNLKVFSFVFSLLKICTCYWVDDL